MTIYAHSSSAHYLHLPKLALFLSLFLFSSIALSNASPFNDTQGSEGPKTALILDNLSQKIDARISIMKLIAKSIANDAHIHEWINSGFAPTKEALLLEKLGFFVDEYSLTSASFADKNTHQYWNHEGFLRVLDPNIDTWYFNYLAKAEQDLISVYHDKNKKRVDIYVNYQQIDGKGLSGIATSFDGVLDMLATSKLAATGQLYLVKPDGSIKLDANNKLAENTLIQHAYTHSDIQRVFNQPFSSSERTNGKATTLNANAVKVKRVPAMNWYLVYIDAKH